MIIFVRGLIAETSAGCVDVDVQGVGYRVWVPDRTAVEMQRGTETMLYTYHYIREDSQELYGFLTDSERAWFTLLIGVSGIGPKVALQIISSADYQRFVSSVQMEDSAYLCQLPGIGKKTAQRLILDLKDKMSNLYVASDGPLTSQRAAAADTEYPESLRSDVVEALKSLGYNERQAVTAVTSVLSHNEDWTLETALTRCLQQMGS
ncbi:Holliday junction branch migration protein RuvA [Alicyclobacillus sp. SO9]|uniref:Holliday junction branch migration protein RuvA n=1 Tax=Alicyclobacillus sp. SO9 TaxID=2665646 RepID=UPI0018E85111|nr:Holliday junction branch migration protein RuvA [Alicyclobacillus sp. SO9]QQE77463.1 Holliday junction branch migration protein RuvA [Alicyclobacillus sp. SO9]